MSSGSYLSKHKEVLEEYIEKDKKIIVVFTKINNYIENEKTLEATNAEPIKEENNEEEEEGESKQDL